MTIKAHLVELERRHHALESAIHEASKHKSSEDLEIMKLKRQKFHPKDEIERLQHDQADFGPMAMDPHTAEGDQRIGKGAS